MFALRRIFGRFAAGNLPQARWAYGRAANSRLMLSVHARQFSTIEYVNLRKLAKLLGAPDYKMNEEIEHSGTVRLVDNNSKLLGVYNLAEAKKICQQRDLDLVLLNAESDPPTCKAMNYREGLYQRFYAEIVRQGEEDKEKRVQMKNIYLTAKMEEGDLRTRVKAAQKLAASHGYFKVQVRTRQSTLKEAHETLTTFAERVKGEMTPVEDVEQFVLKDVEDDDELDPLNINVQRKFKSLAAAEQESKPLDMDELKKILNEYFEQGQQPKERIAADVTSILGKKAKAPVQAKTQETKTEKKGQVARKTVEKDDSPLLASFRAKYDNQDAFDEAIEEIKRKYGQNREKALIEHTLDQHIQALRKSYRVLTIARKAHEAHQRRQ